MKRRERRRQERAEKKVSDKKARELLKEARATDASMSWSAGRAGVFRATGGPGSDNRRFDSLQRLAGRRSSSF